MGTRGRLAVGDRARASLALAGAAFLFGSTFVVVQDAVEAAEPLPFLVVRFFFGLLVLLPLATWRRRRTPSAPVAPGLLRAGIGAGLALSAGYALQTIGLQYTTSSVSAFVTYLLVIFVPLLSAIALRRPPLPATVAGVALSVAGLALLSAGDGVGAGRATCSPWAAPCPSPSTSSCSTRSRPASTSWPSTSSSSPPWSPRSPCRPSCSAAGTCPCGRGAQPPTRESSSRRSPSASRPTGSGG
ncbi:MAG: DMT family transporter [Acidimicrobiia bacterium]|nr:DMT family transporter [Acidimicrobiia bacterium]